MSYFHFICCFFLINVNIAFSQKYVQIEEEVVNIRFKPTTSSSIVGQATLGQVFLRTDALNNWIEIKLPSGENRWIYRPLVSLVNDYGAILEEVNISSLKQALASAKERAANESLNKNIESMSRNEVQMFLLDKFSLSVFRTYGVSPIHYDELMNSSFNESDIMFGNLYEKEVRTSFIDYDVFEVLGENTVIETKRCFKIDKRMDAVIRISSKNGNREESLCFIGGYGDSFDDCYSIKNVFKKVSTNQGKQYVLTNSGKLKEAKLILESSEFDLGKFDKKMSY